MDISVAISHIVPTLFQVHLIIIIPHIIGAPDWLPVNSHAQGWRQHTGSRLQDPHPDTPLREIKEACFVDSGFVPML